MAQQTASRYTYVLWLLREEAPIFILAAIGTGMALIQRRNRSAVFAGIWAFVLLAAYSVIPYKTPWVLLNIIIIVPRASPVALGSRACGISWCSITAEN
jgi:predicted membrane-bound mannosyltransferase